MVFSYSLGCQEKTTTVVPLEGMTVDINCQFDRLYSHPVDKYLGMYVNWARKTHTEHRLGSELKKKEKLS